MRLAHGFYRDLVRDAVNAGRTFPRETMGGYTRTTRVLRFSRATRYWYVLFDTQDAPKAQAAS